MIVMVYTDSPLVSYTKISPNKTVGRKHIIDTITPHCVVGQLSAKQVCDNIFAKPSRKASSNYVIGKDGEIALCVREKDRSWCSSNAANDHRAVTIEVASDTKPPYAITDAAYKSLVKLCADICRRNGIESLKWQGDKSLIGHTDKQNITVHKWFANKDCPGEYIYSRLGRIADEVNEILNGSKEEIQNEPFAPIIGKVSISNLNIRTGPGTDYPKTGRFTGKGVFTIVETASGKGSKKGWGRLKSGAGWISLDYLNIK